MKVSGLLQTVCRIEQLGFFEIIANELQANRHALFAKTSGHAHARQPGQAGRQRLARGDAGQDGALALLERAGAPRAKILRYADHAANQSLFNTPPTFSGVRRERCTFLVRTPLV